MVQQVFRGGGGGGVASVSGGVFSGGGGADRPNGRPCGEVRQALMRSACELVPTIRERSSGAHKGATLKELAAAACVGNDAALHTVKNMVRGEELEVVGFRDVEYRNKPVAEYAPRQASGVVDASQYGVGFVELRSALEGWGRYHER